MDGMTPSYTTMYRTYVVGQVTHTTMPHARFATPCAAQCSVLSAQPYKIILQLVVVLVVLVRVLIDDFNMHNTR